MARTVLSLALLACLGLAILQSASAQEQNQELEDKTPNNVALQIEPDEQKNRLLREADAKNTKKNRGKKAKNNRGDGKKKRTRGKGKKKSRRAKNGNRKKNIKVNGSGKKREKGVKGKKKSRRTKKGNENKNGSGRKRGRNNKECKRNNKGRCVKKSRSGKKNRRGKKFRGGNGCNKGERGKKCRSRNVGNDDKKKKDILNKPNAKPNKRQACDTEALCQKIKDYIKYSNQLRKLRRINKTCSTMEKKRDKASAGEFTASGTANDDSDNTTVQAIADKLKNCTTSAKEKCETKAITGCTNTALNAKCEVELDAWIKKFGPAKGSCLQASASCCACINAISPAPSDDCLAFEPLDKASKDKKKECTGSGTDGSFGNCRKLQMEAAEKGPKAHKEKCKDDNKVTTAKSSGRRMIFRNKLMKKFVKT